MIFSSIEFGLKCTGLNEENVRVPIGNMKIYHIFMIVARPHNL